MRTFKNLMLVTFIAIATVFTACEKTDEPKKGKEYPAGSIVWPKDTVVTLKDHFIVPKGKSLYIEEGAQIVASDTLIRPEFIVLGNLYAYGTAQILFASRLMKNTVMKPIVSKDTGVV